MGFQKSTISSVCTYQQSKWFETRMSAGIEGVEASAAPVKVKKPRRAPRSKATVADASAGSMVLGSNLHSDAQGRMLCSSSVKVCNSRPVVGYGFCKTHILEDKNAPFKQCEATARGRQCTLVVSVADNIKFCGIHSSLERRAAAANAQNLIASSLPDSDAPPSAPLPRSTLPPSISSPSVSAFIDYDVTESEDDDFKYQTPFAPLFSPQTPLNRFSALFPPLMEWSKEGRRLEQEREAQEKLELGHPNFSLDNFLHTRQNQLLRNVQYYRMRIGQMQMAYERQVNEEARERAREEARLKNEASCLLIDEKRRLRTLEKLYRRRYEEEQKKREQLASGALGEEGEEQGTHGTLGTQSAAALSLAGGSQARSAAHNALLSSSSLFSSSSHIESTPSSPSVGGALSSPSSAPRSRSKASSSSPSSSLLPPVGSSSSKQKIASVSKCSSALPPCSEPSLPLSSFCYRHILLDPLQRFFVSCSFDSSLFNAHLRDLGLSDQKCDFPVIRDSSPLLCALHAELLCSHSNSPHPSRLVTAEDDDDDVDVEEDD